MDGLLERIERGMTTLKDAQAVASIVSRMATRMVRYEITLRWIAEHGHGEEAMRAQSALENSDDDALLM
jgi:hypothetical protein